MPISSPYTSDLLQTSLRILTAAFFTFTLASSIANAQAVRGVICTKSTGELVVRRNCRGQRLTRVDTDSLRGLRGETGPMGATGAQGIAGEPGTDGLPGEGLAEGGDTGQILIKSTNNDFETEWQDLPESIAFNFSGSSVDNIPFGNSLFPVDAREFASGEDQLLDLVGLSPYAGVDCSRVRFRAAFDCLPTNVYTFSLVRHLTSGVAGETELLCQVSGPLDNSCQSAEVDVSVQGSEILSLRVENSFGPECRVFWNLICLE